ncbi:hypothetical protein [Methanocorpusculum vombati]|uniref:Radical SAM protein n=1 Tax=Methanocorpusculum vombati TaxID=3002864 RepID=A0ABT4IKK2_9EURY|nr:hypothetical protein [Methanocorpusculum vombati]MCZ9319580.1 hypothetical protein [Methanocorpusculum sp.]MCZ0862269.1 hypothetical protein [Methanocorpusculum vombati]MDE2519813.1 hypothetical protein [Methanocorpusculum sp.]MDE2534471.1 hypothetical protein [Methanocorpusculum sp.]MDE2545636.1 hypothetical protein [Methanocorpusculum sp.]
MKIRLVDVDSTIPNLALMQISAYHKQRGDIVGFDVQNPDKVYISTIFSKNKSQAVGIATLYPQADIIQGGSGFDLHSTIPNPAQKIMPDYSLYNSPYDLGFTTRGCIRKCPFCIVPEKEGKLEKWMNISDFHHPDHKTAVLLDNNILAKKDWFFDQTDWAIDHNIKLNITQGMDIRLITPEIAEQLARIKWAATLHFAFDSLSYEQAVETGLSILVDAGINIRRNVDFYVLVGFDTTIAEDIYRCNLLKRLGTNAFVMQYRKTPETIRLARWANRRNSFWAVDFENYTHGKKIHD